VANPRATTFGSVCSRPKNIFVLLILRKRQNSKQLFVAKLTLTVGNISRAEYQKLLLQ
jgi:hypothetical protein